MRSWPLAIALSVALPACADRNEAKDIRDEIESDDYRRTYERAPGFDARTASSAPHGAFVDIYVNDVITEALDAAEPLDAWPEGSIIVKDGWSAAEGGDFEYLAFMERRDQGWFWAEFRGNGRLVAAGLDDSRCADCHASGADQVRAFGLP